MGESSEFSVTPLGTVSPYCKGDRNCPGFLIENRGCKLLLDCGSGVSRLLKFPDDLENLVILITHLHKDHYSDLASFAYASYVYKNAGKLKNKIKVLIPECEETTKFDYQLLMNYGVISGLEFYTYKENSKFNIGSMKVSFLQNPHAIKTYSVKVQTGDKMVVYSSDTGFKEDHLDLFALGADLFICESSLLKNQNKDGNNHLCAYEAALTAMAADVKQLVLTHFWPEFDKKLYVDEAMCFFENTIAAEEGKKILIKK